MYCSITGYGSDGSDADRPGDDALVAARMGQQWEVRGVLGGTIGRLAGYRRHCARTGAPPAAGWDPNGTGRCLPGVPWVSMPRSTSPAWALTRHPGAGDDRGGASTSTPRSFMALATTVGAWQQVQNPDVPYFQTWIIDHGHAKGFFKGSDGRCCTIGSPGRSSS